MKKFIWKDKSGRGFSNTLTTTDLLQMDDEQDWNDELLHEFATEAQPGDTWEDQTKIFTCIENAKPVKNK